MTDARLYAKIMRHLEDTTGTGSWDFKTMRSAHPQLAAVLERLITNVDGISSHDKATLHKHYVPSRLWAYATDPMSTISNTPNSEQYELLDEMLTMFLGFSSKNRPPTSEEVRGAIAGLRKLPNITLINNNEVCVVSDEEAEKIALDYEERHREGECYASCKFHNDES